MQTAANNTKKRTLLVNNQLLRQKITDENEEPHGCIWFESESEIYEIGTEVSVWKLGRKFVSFICVWADTFERCELSQPLVRTTNHMHVKEDSWV